MLVLVINQTVSAELSLYPTRTLANICFTQFFLQIMLITLGGINKKIEITKKSSVQDVIASQKL